MALSRSKEEVQKFNSSMGIKFRPLIRIIETFISLSKGREPMEEGRWFYSMFLNRPRVPASFDSAEEIRAKLASAWWVEEDDIRQQIYLFIKKHNLTEYHHTKQYLSGCLRDWLIRNQRVFSRQRNWEPQYSISIDNLNEKTEECDLSFIFQDDSVLKRLSFTKFERYIAYLSYILEICTNDIGEMILIDGRMVRYYLADLKQKLEEKHVAA